MDLRTKKIFWRERRTRPYGFICPLCASPRRVPLQPRPTLRHYAQIGLTAACFTLLTWPLFGLKGIVSFVPIWTIFEVLYRGQVRGSLLCPHCGFDPLLYLTDVQAARIEVETHWRKKFEEKGVPYPEKPKDPVPPVPPSAGRLVATNRPRGPAKTGAELIKRHDAPG